MDMRKVIAFPRPPSTKEEIYNPNILPWHLACALVGEYGSYQYNTYRKFCALLGEDRFRDVLDVTRIILDESNNIHCPPAFLTAQFAAELSLGGLRRDSL